MTVQMKDAFVIGCGTLAAIMIAGAISLTISRPANATPEYTKQTGKACGDCHQSPSGGALSPFGEQFKANGHQLPKPASK